MITHIVSISAIIPDERIAVAAEPGFSNVVCRECALWGAPNAPCRQRLTFVRKGYSQIAVTCLSFAKSLDLVLQDKLKELELANANLVTAQHNIRIKEAQEKKESNPRTTQKKMDKLLRILEGTPEVDSVLIHLQAQEAEAETRIKKLTAEVQELQNRMGNLPNDPNSKRV